ncbi:MAG: hypothetical protein AB7O04_04025 [Hyphomonadaceae bacterium]
MVDQASANAPLTMEGAAGEAFRKRDRSFVLTTATIVFVLSMIVIFIAFVLLNRQGIAAYMDYTMQMAAQGPNAQPAMPPPEVMGLVPAYFLTTVIIYLLFAAYEAGCLRWLIHGEQASFVGLDFGAPMLRVWFGYWCWLILLILFYIALVIAIVVATAITVGGRSAPGTVALTGIVVSLVMALLLSALAVRFAPAAALSVAKRRFAFFDAWKVTRDKFWSLFGAFALIFVLYIFAVIVLFVVGAFVVFGAAAGHLASVQGTPDPTALMTALSQPSAWISALVLYGIYFVVAFAFVLALYGVNARAAMVAKANGEI